jgi:nucleoside-diphosphate-sugar epimerase
VGDRLVLVTGATGAVGPSVVRACLAAGYRVRAFSLERPDDTLPQGVDARIGDICDAAAVREAARGVDVVVHLAALLHQFKNVTGLDREFERVNVGGTDHVVRAAVAEGVRRLVFLSTIAVYGSSTGGVIDERTEPQPDTGYGRSKLAAERLVLSASSSGTPLGVVLRSAAVYGGRVKGNYRRLAEAIARRRFVQIGDGLNRRTVVHDSDLAAAIVLAASHANAAGRTFNVSDGHVHALADIIAAIYRAIGRRPPRLHVPLGAAGVAIAMCEGGCRLVGVSAPVTRRLLEKYTEDVAVDATAIRAELGFTPAMDLDAGWKETIAALRATAC